MVRFFAETELVNLWNISDNSAKFELVKNVVEGVPLNEELVSYSMSDNSNLPLHSQPGKEGFMRG